MKKYETGIFERDFNEIRRNWKGWEGEKMEGGAMHQVAAGFCSWHPLVNAPQLGSSSLTTKQRRAAANSWKIEPKTNAKTPRNHKDWNWVFLACWRLCVRPSGENQSVHSSSFTRRFRNSTRAPWPRNPMCPFTFARPGCLFSLASSLISSRLASTIVAPLSFTVT